MVALRREKTDSLAVLPFVNASADETIEYLSDGITETLINKLSQLPGLRVMSRATVFHYKEPERELGLVGRRARVPAGD